MSVYTRILVALDGSGPSVIGGDIALSLASGLGSEVVATHIYDAGIHTSRFVEMEPVLPDRYQDAQIMTRLRESHDGLISEGFDALSRGYVDEFVAKARKKVIAVREVHRQGRNYVELLNIAREEQANLLVLGASGLGDVDGYMGSNARRVLQGATCDVLIARRAITQGGSVLVGIDGSEDSLSALRKGVQCARLFGKTPLLTAAYDPAFHTKVFRVMGRSLSAERQEEVGLNKQEELHDQIIDDGLGKLYQTFLDQAEEQCRAIGLDCTVKLVQAKAFKGLLDVAAVGSAELSVVGRFGHNRTALSTIGSNTEAFAALASSNVLVTAAVEPAADDGATAITWSTEAEEALRRVPSFAQPMARGAVEKQVQSEGRSEVSLKDFRDVAAKFGMGPPGHGGGHGNS